MVARNSTFGKTLRKENLFIKKREPRLEAFAHHFSQILLLAVEGDAHVLDLRHAQLEAVVCPVIKLMSGN